MRIHLSTFLLLLLALHLPAAPASGDSWLRWGDAGTYPDRSDPITICGEAKPIEVQVAYSYRSTTIPTHKCPGGTFGANPYRYTVTLLRDGQPVSAPRQFKTSSCYFRTRFSGIDAVPGDYTARVAFEKRVFISTWRTVETVTSSRLVAELSQGEPDFTVNGQAVPSDGSPIVVPSTHPVLVDGSLSRCMPNYFAGVHESERWWHRTGDYEWGRWFDGSPPSDLNYQELTTRYSPGPDFVGDPARQGAAMTGGTLGSGKDRYYRIELCTSQRKWKCKIALIKVE